METFDSGRPLMSGGGSSVRDTDGRVIASEKIPLSFVVVVVDLTDSTIVIVLAWPSCPVLVVVIVVVIVVVPRPLDCFFRFADFYNPGLLDCKECGRCMYQRTSWVLPK